VLEFDCRVRERQQRSGCFWRKPEAESGRNPEDEGGGPLWTGGSVDITCHVRGFKYFKYFDYFVLNQRVETKWFC